MSGKTIQLDERGAEFAVDTGFGVITKVEYKERNASVELEVRGLRLPVKGWIDYSDPAVAEMLELKEKAGILEYRIESRRAEAIDPTIPFDQLKNFDKFRRYVILRQTGASEAPPPGPGESKPIPNEAPPTDGPVANTPANGPSGNGPLANEPTKTTPAPPSGGDRTDTWAYNATLGLAELAFELLVDAGQTLTGGTVRALAERLLAIADAGQACVRAAGVDRNANSHTRARGALRSALTRYPVPLTPAAVDDETLRGIEGDFSDALPALMDQWQQRMSRAVCLLMQVGLDMLAPPAPPGE